VSPHRSLEELRRVEEELREREKQLVQAQRLANLGGWEWDLEAGRGDGRLTWTRELYRIYGFEPGSVEPDFGLVFPRIHPDDRERVETNVRHAREDGSGFFHQYRFRRDDGDERVLLAQAEAVRDDEGRLLSLIGTVQDATDRVRRERQDRELAFERRARAASEAERRRLADMFEQAPAAITITRGPNHVFEISNEVFRAILGHEDFVGRSVAEVFPDAEDRAFLRRLDEVYETGEPFTAREVEVPVRREDGVTEPAWFHFVYQPLFGEDDRVTGIMLHGVEITEQIEARRQLEDKARELARMTRRLGKSNRALERSNKELDQFAYVASHDLKAPLRGISNLSQWIEEDLVEETLPEETREQLALMRNRVMRMEALIDALLEYSRVGRVRKELETVEVRPLIEETVELLAPPEDTEITLTGDFPRLDTERLLLSQVFLNLIGNAVKHAGKPDSGEAPRIEVSVAEHDEDLYEFAVADNGAGIAPEYQERIFGIFQTLQARDKVEGTGIGLALVRKIVETHGGEVWVDSEPGGGATFRFTWPRQPLPNEETTNR
jgi:PAS domain S-box-containing protein